MMKLFSQREGAPASRMERESKLGEDREAAWTGATDAPAIRRAAEPRRWSARMTIGTSKKGKPGKQEWHLASRQGV